MVELGECMHTHKNDWLWERQRDGQAQRDTQTNGQVLATWTWIPSLTLTETSS